MAAARKKTSRSSSSRNQSRMSRFADWWGDTSLTGKISAITAIIIGVTGSIVGTSHAWPYVKDYWYVAQYELKLVESSQAIATDRQTLFQLQQYLANARKDPKAAASPTAQEYIANLLRQIEDTQKRINKTGSVK